MFIFAQKVIFHILLVNFKIFSPEFETDLQYRDFQRPPVGSTPWAFIRKTMSVQAPMGLPKNKIYVVKYIVKYISVM